jgi:LPS export ABC transporter protein LptC
MLKNILYWSVLALVSLFSRQQAIAEDGPVVRKPILETTDLELIYSENGVVTAQVKAPKQLQYTNGDTVYPEGIEGIVYSQDKKIAGSIHANQAYQYVEQNIYELKGDVEIKNYYTELHKQLNTEELYWNLADKEIYTDTFVRIESVEELLTGYGLFAKQDLSYYTISEPEGFAHIESIREQLDQRN